MDNIRSVSRALFTIVAVLLSLALPAACQGAATSEPLPLTAPPDQQISGKRTIGNGMGAPLSDYYIPPQSIQDLVNRYDVVFTGAIAAVGNPVAEKPYDWDAEEEARDKSRGIPPFRIRVTYYEIQIDEVFLDDGNLKANPRLRLSGDHSAIRPQEGERFLFVLAANPDAKSYGLNADWNLIHLDGGAIRNFDGESPGYVGIVDEASLRSAIQEAVSSRVYLPMARWPIREHWLADENAPAETPAAPGGPGADDTGPTGNTNN